MTQIQLVGSRADYFTVLTFIVDSSTQMKSLCKIKINYWSSHRRRPVKKVFLEIFLNSKENTCARVSFLVKLQAKVCNFIKKETLTQMFSCEFCESSKNTFFTECLRTTAFVTIFSNKNNCVALISISFLINY